MAGGAGTGVSIVPSLMRSVTIAAAASVAHGSVAQMPSQTKNPCQPDGPGEPRQLDREVGSLPV